MNNDKKEDVGMPFDCNYVGADPRGQAIYVLKLPDGTVVPFKMPYDLRAPELNQEKLMEKLKKNVQDALKDFTEQQQQAALNGLALFSLDYLQQGCSLLDDYAMMFKALRASIDTTSMSENERRQLQIHDSYVDKYLEATFEQSEALGRLNKKGDK